MQANINNVHLSGRIWNIIYIICGPDLHKSQVRRKKTQKVANSGNLTYYKCQNEKYFQIWLFLKHSLTCPKSI